MKITSKITRDQIRNAKLDAERTIKERNLKRSYNSTCLFCLIHYIRHFGDFNVHQPCSYIKRILNDQYHTKFRDLTGCTNEFVELNALDKIFSRTIKL